MAVFSLLSISLLLLSASSELSWTLLLFFFLLFFRTIINTIIIIIIKIAAIIELIKIDFLFLWQNDLLFSIWGRGVLMFISFEDVLQSSSYLQTNIVIFIWLWANSENF